MRQADDAYVSTNRRSAAGASPFHWFQSLTNKPRRHRDQQTMSATEHIVRKLTSESALVLHRIGRPATKYRYCVEQCLLDTCQAPQHPRAALRRHRPQAWQCPPAGRRSSRRRRSLLPKPASRIQDRLTGHRLRQYRRSLPGNASSTVRYNNALRSSTAANAGSRRRSYCTRRRPRRRSPGSSPHRSIPASAPEDQRGIHSLQYRKQGSI